ncbi:MAG: MFS transporter, partial [Aeromicrobium sp.]
SMMITPAAMFAMFFFLSLMVQNVMGYSPLRTGFAFLPFCVGMIAGATISSKLIAKIDPRYLAGTGTILAGIALYMFSRITVDDSAANILSLATNGGMAGDSINYWTQIAPGVVLMSFGMGLTFVSMTLVAVYGIPAEESGIGSGVLNTMQQVGGAIGLAALSTVAVHFTRDKAAEISAAMSSGGGPAPSADVQQRISDLVGQSAFTSGGTHAFLVGAFMIWTASAIVWMFLNVKHHELVGDELPEGVLV